MSQPNDGPNPFDPLGFWRTTQNASLEAWSKAMIQFVNTDAYAQATGRILDSYLSASLPMRTLVEQAMTQALGQMSMPARAEVLSIAERMTNIEIRLDDLDARFDELQRLLTQIAANVAQPQPERKAAAKETPSRSAAAATRRSKSASTTTATSNSRHRRSRAVNSSERSTAARSTKE